MAAGFHGNAVIEKDWNLIPQLILSLAVRNSDAGAALVQE
jgi:hypothetical protein